ncbi:MAG: outer membrane beta-barrel protein [Pseudomonadota bacterium]
MRLLVLGVSAIALGACSVGSGYSWQGSQGGHGHAVDYYGGYGHSHHQPSGYTSDSCGVAVSPCGGYTPPPAYQPPVYTPPPSPVHSPCAPVSHPCDGGSYSVAGHGYSSHDYYGGGYSSAPSYNYGAGHRGHVYGTLGAVMYDFEDEAFGIQGRLGYQFNPNFGAEVEGSVGVIDDTEDLGGGDQLKTGVDYSAAAFGTVRAPITPRLSTIARLGYHTTRLTSESTIANLVTETNSNEDGLAYGLGAEYKLSPVDAIRADYTAYEVDNGTLDSISLAYLRRF